MPRIFIADDHPMVRRGIRQILAEEFSGLVAAEAGSAAELLSALQDPAWDLIILDIGMPGASGLDALERVKDLAPGVPVLILTMYPESKYALRAFQQGAAGYLTKDAVASDLVTAVRTVLEGGRYVTPSLASVLVERLAAPAPPPHEALSGREREVFSALIAGRSVSEIAGQLSLSVKTVSTYRARVFEKLGVKTIVDLTRYAIDHNLLD